MGSRRTFAGRYRLDAPIAEGGMARVFRATDLVLGRTVVVKVLPEELAGDERFVTRFRREARAAASLAHPNVAAVFDTGSEDGTDYIVMENVEGRSLGDLIRAEGSLAAPRAGQIAREVCQALEAAHARRIVHRDIKPGNILLASSGVVKVTDFGIAQGVGPTLTEPSTLLGTASYLSPEQARGDRVDGRSDLYSLGCVLYEMLAGRPPFDGDNPVTVARRHIEEEPVPLRAANPQVPADIEAVVARAMAKDPTQRFGDATEMAEALSGTAGVPDRTGVIEPDAEDTAIITAPEGIGADRPATPSTPTPGRTLPLSARLVATYTLLIAATLLVVAGVAIHLARRHLQGALDDRLVATVDSFSAGPSPRVEDPADLGPQSRRWLALRGFSEDQLAVVRIRGGQVLEAAGGLDLKDFPEAPDLLSATRSRWWNLEHPDGPIRALTVPLVLDGRQEGTLVVAASRSEVDGALGGLLTGIGWASGIGLVFAGILGFSVGHRTLRPLREMSGKVEAIQAAGDLSRRIRHRGPRDEVRRLAEAFDRMLARLQGSFDSQRRFLSDASHELRTPLTVAQGQLELLGEQIREAESRGSISLALNELHRMRRIVDDLLLLARLEEGMPMIRERVEVELVLREAMLRAMQAGRRQTEVRCESNLYATADRERLLQALTNLLTNAVQHAGEDARIGLTARLASDRLLIDVSDTGPGIAEEELAHVFDRFYRGVGARTGPQSGAGLGLSISRSLIRAMGGEITVRSQRGEGTTFTVSLPASGLPEGEGARHGGR